jgi:hypothetical protein
MFRESKYFTREKDWMRTQKKYNIQKNQQNKTRLCRARVGTPGRKAQQQLQTSGMIAKQTSYECRAANPRGGDKVLQGLYFILNKLKWAQFARKSVI